MKLFATLLCFSCFSLVAQVTEKPQQVYKIDTSVVISTEMPIDVEAVQEVYTIEVEDTDPNLAHFPGGYQELMDYLNTRVEEFIFADTNEVFPFGESVHVAFEVNALGKITNPFIELGYNAYLDSTALRFVREMPDWIPAKDPNGQAISSVVRVEVLFDFEVEEPFEDPDFEGPPEESNKYAAHWAGYEFSLTQNMNGPFNFGSDFSNHPYWENKVSKSFSMNLNLFQWKFPIIRQYLGITTGYGFQFNRMEFSGNYNLMHPGDTSLYATLDPTQDYKVNSLNTGYFTIPLLLDFSTKKYFKNAFYFNAGVLGGVKMYSIQHQTGTYVNGDQFENNTKSAYCMNPFSLEATVRAGYSFVGFYASYALISPFKTGVTVPVYPFKFGISLSIPQ
jgi:hypothetical protein